MKETLIDVKDLCIQFETSGGTVKAVTDGKTVESAKYAEEYLNENK